MLFEIIGSSSHLKFARISPKPNLPTHFSIQQEAKSKYDEDESSMDIVASPNTFQKILAEFLGTYILIFAGCGSALVDREAKLTIVGIAMVWGLVLMVVIYTVGHISGAHVNPAVSIALGASRKLPLTLVPVYVLSQLMGATLACLTLRVLYSSQRDIKPTVTQYSDSLTDLQALVFEFIITFILMFTICGVATDDRASKGVAGAAIGATVGFNVLIAGPKTGASMNPARSIGPAVVSGEFKNLWVYVVAPILGALLAVLVYSVFQQPEPRKSKEKTKLVSNDLYSEA